MTQTQYSIGDLRLDYIHEATQSAINPWQFLPKLPPDAIERNRDWMVPYFYDTAADQLIMSTQGWVLRTKHHTILIETCGGNHKDRPHYPRAHQLNTPWLERLKAAGVAPEEVDFVFCSHLHVDHIGWFTQLVDGRWLPTFPNAKHLIVRREYENWDPKTRTLPPAIFQDQCFEDCVAPVVEAGLVVFVEDGYQIDDGITVEASYGHTLGHCSVRATSRGETGIFCGDIMHSPIEMTYPHVDTYSCEDLDAARAVRIKLLEEAAEYGHALMPEHFPPPFHICRTSRKGDGFALEAYE